MATDPSERGTWRILDVLDWTRGFFEGRGIESARLDAEVLLAHVLGLPRIMLYARFDQPLTSPERDRYRELVRRRAAREPVAYLVGEKEFWSLTLEVRRGVLIPRPDSEVLVQVGAAELARDRPVRVADVGTGSGALALALATEVPNAEIVAADVAPAALELAARNVERLGLSERVRVVKSDLLRDVEVPPRFDLVVANLPYIPTSELASLMPDVRDHEPPEALDGGPDGLDLVRRLIAEAPPRLERRGGLLLEAGREQVRALAEELKRAGYREVSVHSDLAGSDRAVFGRR